MKANELRIGNLVHFNGDHKEVGVVSEILKNDLTKVSLYKIGINHRTDIYYDIDKLEPIQLTEESLINLGFIKHNDKLFFVPIPNLSMTIHAVFYRGEWSIELDNDGIKTVTGVVEVHRLQNLHFALTNPELL